MNIKHRLVNGYTTVYNFRGYGYAWYWVSSAIENKDKRLAKKIWKKKENEHTAGHTSFEK
jgi:hypothetical protein